VQEIERITVLEKVFISIREVKRDDAISILQNIVLKKDILNIKNRDFFIVIEK
jgi:hypothetical protein